jgi:hypothetical protein
MKVYALNLFGTSDYIWHLFDRLDGLRPIFK